MRLCSNEECTGCFACYNICNKEAIEISTDEEGFVHPLINLEKCIDCGLCATVCPILTPYVKKGNDKIKCYAAWNKKSSIVRTSSSGGFFSTIANWIILNGGIVYGASFDKNFCVHHVRVTSVQDIEQLKGSKYVQSDIGKIYNIVKKDIQSKKWILFTGTPCQVDGLLRVLGNLSNYEKLITIDIVCHGVPSPLMFREYKTHLEGQYKSTLCSYEFRDKQWSWLHFNTKAVFSSGVKYLGTWEEDLFMRGFLREYYLRPSCHQCQYANKHRVSDFTMADYWGYKRKKHEVHNNDTGVSIVLAHSEKAKELLVKIRPSMYIYPRALEEATLGNEAFETPFPPNPCRDEFWNDYKNFGYEKLVAKYLYPEPISKDLRCLYKYGKMTYKIVSLLKRIIRKLKKELNL